MTLLKTKTGGWSYAEVLTSEQLTAIDNSIEGALDKRAGETDQLKSNITINGGGTVDVYNGSDISFLTGSLLNIGSGSSFQVNSGSNTIINLGAAGRMNITSTGIVSAESGGLIAVKAGAFFETRTGSDFKIKAGTNVVVESGAAVELNIDGSGNVVLDGTTLSCIGSTFVELSGGSTLDLESYPRLQPNKSLTRNVNISNYQATDSGGTTGAVTRNIQANMSSPRTSGVVTSGGAIVFISANSSAISVGVMIPIDHALVDGSLFESLSYSLQRGSTDDTAPIYPVAVSIVRKLWTSASMQVLHSGGHFVADPTGDTTAQHTVGVTLNQFNVVDKANYSYWIQFWNEMGDVHVQSGLKIYGARVFCSGIADMRIA